MTPIKSAAIAFIVSMGAFLGYHLLSSGGSTEFEGLQNLGQLAAPISAVIAGIAFVIACVYKVASRGE